MPFLSYMLYNYPCTTAAISPWQAGHKIHCDVLLGFIRNSAGAQHCEWGVNGCSHPFTGMAMAGILADITSCPVPRIIFQQVFKRLGSYIAHCGGDVVVLLYEVEI
jgi:hypothetical protein